MLARSELVEHILDHYGHCDREGRERNDCYWGKDARGRDNGCLKVGWLGRRCQHWHPVDDMDLEQIVAAHGGGEG